MLPVGSSSSQTSFPTLSRTPSASRVQEATSPFFISIPFEGETLLVSTRDSDLSLELAPVLSMKTPFTRNNTLKEIVAKLSCENPTKANSIALLIDNSTIKEESFLMGAREIYRKTREIEKSLSFLSNDTRKEDLFFSWAVRYLLSFGLNSPTLIEVSRIADRCHCPNTKDDLFFLITMEFTKTAIDDTTLKTACSISNPERKASCLKKIINILRGKIENQELSSKKAQNVSLALKAASHINDPSKPHATTYLVAEICANPPFSDTLFDHLNENNEIKAQNSLTTIRNKLFPAQYDLFIDGVLKILEAQISDCNLTSSFFTLFFTTPSRQKELFLEVFNKVKKRPSLSPDPHINPQRRRTQEKN